VQDTDIANFKANSKTWKKPFLIILYKKS
jgi:hypothetical protein